MKGLIIGLGVGIVATYYFMEEYKASKKLAGFSGCACFTGGGCNCGGKCGGADKANFVLDNGCEFDPRNNGLNLVAQHQCGVPVSTLWNDGEVLHFNPVKGLGEPVQQQNRPWSMNDSVPDASMPRW